MGNQLPCTLLHQGKTYSGKALLETSELLFRGETRLKIALAAITSAKAKDGELHLRTKEGLAVFQLGPQAEKWREKIANPKSVVEKLGVKPTQSVSVLGNFSPDFVESLKKQGALLTKGKIHADSVSIFFAAEEKQDLRRLPSISQSNRGATALWIVYPKGQKSITEADVRSAGLAAGLVDIKVVGFSATHTALKFVLPQSKR
jgi:hypothetical protein